ncbi:MAG TPA: cyclic nucleotide-binding domain-containing protein, partial [Candidatus Handelsmanbacteria bacterium]|nr:cyclic nucleotide-binding domain-containing protein [Candidatus Handelsmanbacteria bacterium]
MSETYETTPMEVIKICPGSFLLKVPEAGVSWLFNAWPDITKYLIQQQREINGVVYPDLRMQTSKGISCNLIEFPLLHAMFNQGMFFRNKKPCLIGTEHQLTLASESFRRGLYGFNSAEELVDCDLSAAEIDELMCEIKGLSLNGIQPIDELLELVPLVPLQELPSELDATCYNGVQIWKEDLNVFSIEYQGHRVSIDCTLAVGEEYWPPLKIDVKNVPYKLFQIIDTGEEDGFSTKSCMHTVIQWRDRIICVDLPMNASYLLGKVSISKTEVDAVIFTHNHDDHIGDFSLLLQMDRKLTIFCPRVIWRAILLKASAVFDMSVDELAEYFDYVPIVYGEEYDYAGLRILAHPSIHSVPCAIYRIRGIVNGEWKTYGHMSDILNFQRCQKLLQEGHLTTRRLADYKKFVMEPAAVKKIDVGARDGTEDFSVHGSWRDFIEDKSEHIVLAHTSADALDERAKVQVGQFAVAGSARDMGERGIHTYHDQYRERALSYLADYLFSLLETRLEDGDLGRHRLRSYLRILADNEIRVIQPYTPFLKEGGEPTFVDVVISGAGSLWDDRDGELTRVATVQAGDVIGDMGILLKMPRTATIRSDTYMHLLRIPAMLFEEVAVALGITDKDNGQSEGVIEKVWRHRKIVQHSGIFGAEVPFYLQNKVAQRADDVCLQKGDVLLGAAGERSLFISDDCDAFAVEVDSYAIDAGPYPVFGEAAFTTGEQEAYRVVAR